MFLLCFELTIFTEQTYANNINKDGGQRYVYIEHLPLSEKLNINPPPQKKKNPAFSQVLEINWAFSLNLSARLSHIWRINILFII